MTQHERQILRAYLLEHAAYQNMHTPEKSVLLPARGFFRDQGHAYGSRGGG